MRAQVVSHFLTYALTFFAGVHLHRSVTEVDPVWPLLLCIASLAFAYINAQLSREDRP